MWSGSCELQEANRWADQPQREEINLYGELELRNRFIQESQAKYCQEIEELRGICREETDRARQARIDELSIRQERNPTTVSQLLAQIRDFQNEVNSASDAREFYDPESGSSSGATHAPSQFRVPGPCLTAILDCCRTHGVFTGTSGNVFERPPAQEGRPFTFFINSKNLASSSQELRPDVTGTTKRTESKNEKRTVEHATPLTTLPKWTRNVESHWWNFFSQWYDRDFRFRNCIWENFLTLWNFKAGM